MISRSERVVIFAMNGVFGAVTETAPDAETSERLECSLGLDCDFDPFACMCRQADQNVM